MQDYRPPCKNSPCGANQDSYFGGCHGKNTYCFDKCQDEDRPTALDRKPLGLRQSGRGGFERGHKSRSSIHNIPLCCGTTRFGLEYRKRTCRQRSVTEGIDGPIATDRLAPLLALLSSATGQRVSIQMRYAIMYSSRRWPTPIFPFAFCGDLNRLRLPQLRKPSLIH